MSKHVVRSFEFLGKLGGPTVKIEIIYVVQYKVYVYVLLEDFD